MRWECLFICSAIQNRSVLHRSCVEHSVPVERETCWQCSAASCGLLKVIAWLWFWLLSASCGLHMNDLCPCSFFHERSCSAIASLLGWTEVSGTRRQDRLLLLWVLWSGCYRCDAKGTNTVRRTVSCVEGRWSQAGCGNYGFLVNTFQLALEACMLQKKEFHKKPFLNFQACELSEFLSCC